MSDCIFCKLAGGEIPTATLFENDEFRVILDAGPASKGHALVLPKAHFANIYEMPEDLTGRAFILAKKMAGVLTEAMGCDGFNIVQNNGSAAGQSVFHFHIHLIPRYKEEPPIVANWNPGSVTDELREEILSKVSAVMSRN
ncbi:MAG: HIT family protein [Lachnospiraceae bacterium]|nr:HIT family protein [Lachnospiraceae bacterium]